VPGLELTRRHGAAASYLFVLNHTDGVVHVPAEGVDLVTGAGVRGKITLEAGDIAVIREGGG
jgi:beta-galactosidase